MKQTVITFPGIKIIDRTTPDGTHFIKYDLNGWWILFLVLFCVAILDSIGRIGRRARK